jgi:hypothetical protein
MDHDRDDPSPKDLSLADLAREANRRKGQPEGKLSVEHEARLNNHDQAIRDLTLKTDSVAKDVHQWELKVERVFSDLEHLMERIPDDLGGNIATLNGKVTTAIRDLDDLKRMLRSDFVTRAELDPIKRLVYGVVGLVLTGVIGGLLGLVILK